MNLSDGAFHDAVRSVARPALSTAFGFFFILLASASVHAADNEIRIFRNVQYAKIDGVDSELLSLDIFSPKKPGKHPVMVMIHGGGWRIGDKANRAMTRHKAPHFVDHGFVYASVNYRLSKTRDDPKHPAHVQDIAKALAWIHDHVGEYGGDPDRIFVMGHSAGAHLAALISTDHRRLKAEGKDLSIIKGAICLDTAAYDIPRYINELNAGRVMRSLCENAFGTSEESWRDASPRHHVAPGKKIPPMLLLHTGHRMEGERLARELVVALREAGTPARETRAADKNHAGINNCIGLPGDRYTKLVMAFIANPRGANGLTLDESGEGDEPLPAVLIIGDSISIGYTKPLTALLEGMATVVHNPGNAQHSAFGVANLEEWLGDRSWDVIHFNHGLHDLKYVDANGKNTRERETGRIQIPLDEYEKNMEAIVQRLEKTGAALIFATTTPFPDKPDGPLRDAYQAVKYNEAACKIMKKHAVRVNDLYAFALPRLEELQQPKNVHFTGDGSMALAGEVARCTLDALHLRQE